MIDTRRAPAKLNIFLKIIGKRDHYHEILSRFILYPHLYDTLTLSPSQTGSFELCGEFGCPPEDNTLTKTFHRLHEATGNQEIIKFCHAHRLSVSKMIPSFAGLGGGSSDAATFAHMINDHLKLGLSTEDLITILLPVGADIPFFLSGLTSANVTGIGEIITPFDDTIPDLTTMTPSVMCSTPAIYNAFRQSCWETIDTPLAHHMSTLSTTELLKTYTPTQLNDLYKAALIAVPTLGQYSATDRFFSGSGSTFFWMTHEHNNCDK